MSQLGRYFVQLGDLSLAILLLDRHGFLGLLVCRHDLQELESVLLLFAFIDQSEECLLVDDLLPFSFFR